MPHRVSPAMCSFGSPNLLCSVFFFNHFFSLQRNMMDFLPQKFLCALPLWVGGAVLGAVGVITSIVGLCGGLKEFDEAIEVLGFNTFSIRSLSGMCIRNAVVHSLFNETMCAYACLKR